MRALLLGAAASLTAVLFAAPASARPNGWYVGIAGGGSWVDDGDVTHNFVGGSHLEFDQEWDSGWIGAGTVGYRWPSHWRMELELAYRDNEGGQVGSPAGGSKLTEFSQMLNAYYDIPLSPKLTFSVGAGIGGDAMSYESPFHPSHEDDYVLAGQLIAQVSFAVTNRLELYLDYHYLMADDPEFDITAFPAENYSFEVKKHAAMIGLRYDLHADEEPAPPLPPPSAPMPPPQPRQFIIFFGFNKCNITAEADAVLGEAASAARSGGGASVRIVGHTDTSGSNAYNQKLSECRAGAAKSNLVGKGVAEGAISTSGRGETELMVQTGDSVKEPQNRRATIDLQ